MVWTDRVSQDVAAVGQARRAPRRAGARRARALPGRHPARVGRRPDRPHPPLRRRRRHRLGAATVVLHPPFRWQRRYAAAVRRRDRPRGRGRRRRAGRGEHVPGRPRAACAPCPTARASTPPRSATAHYTLDLSHTATAGVDALALLDRMGDRLTHLHLADGSGGPRDEHLVPGRGTPALRRGAASGWPTPGYRGAVVAEVSTRRCRTRYERAELLARVAAVRPAAPAAHRRPTEPTGSLRASRGGPTHGVIAAAGCDARDHATACRRAPVPRRRRDRAARRRPVRAPSWATGGPSAPRRTAAC